MLRVEHRTFSWRDLPPELVPARNLALYNETRVQHHLPALTAPPTFDVDTCQRLVFMREQWHTHGVGPLTVRFSDTVDAEWWGFSPDGVDENGRLALDEPTISAALDYSNEWTGITRIRLVPVPSESSSSESSRSSSERYSCERYSYELVRDGALGPETHRPPDALFYIDDSAAKAKLSTC